VTRSWKRPPKGAGLVVSWAGMRGIVTLATALALPRRLARETHSLIATLIILCAFSVVLGTLVIQGLTLRPLLAVLGLKDDGSVDREVRLARVETARAPPLRVLDEERQGDPSVDILRSEYQARIRSGESNPIARRKQRAPYNRVAAPGGAGAAAHDNGPARPAGHRRRCVFTPLRRKSICWELTADARIPAGTPTTFTP